MKEVIRYLAAALGAILQAAALFLARRSGEDALKAKRTQEEIDAVEQANLARDRLRSDPRYAIRVRERFTRHE